MKLFRYKIELGNFAGKPGDSIWIYDINQQFYTTIMAKSISQACKIIEERFGDSTVCRYYYELEIDNTHLE